MTKFGKSLVGLVLAASLGGCMVTSGGTGTPIPAPFPSTGNVTFDAIIAETQTICGFAPALSTVASIVNTFVPGTAVVGTIATGICSALAPKAGHRRGAMRPTYRGIVIQGNRV